MKLPKATLYRIAQVARSLHALRNVADDQCAVDKAAKEAVRLYIDTCILPALHQILREAIHDVPVDPFKMLGRSDDRSACHVIRWIKGMDPTKRIPMHLDLPTKDDQ